MGHNYIKSVVRRETIPGYSCGKWTYEKTTPSGKESPALRPDIMEKYEPSRNDATGTKMRIKEKKMA